jgi:hypothetical protein
MFRRRAKAAPKLLDPRLGLDTILFDTLGWPLKSDDGECRAWVGDRTGVRMVISECFLTQLPQYRSLDIEMIRHDCESWLPEGREPGAGPRVRVIEVEVDPRVPIVRTLVRIPLTEEDDRKLSFLGSLTLLLADCSWIVQVQARDDGVPVEIDGKVIKTTGAREAFAFDRALAESGEQSLEEIEAAFDPYDRRWDGIVPGDPLTTVRQHLDRLQESIQCGPEFYDQAPFNGAAGDSKS